MKMTIHLTDMEELIARIDRAVAKDYMAEALRCYQAGAFRACVVLSYIALFDDLRNKLAPLITVNKVAKTIHLEVEKKAKAQDVYETYLSDQLAANTLIDASQKSNLEMIIKLRNKAAHPSGIHASAEEARYVFFETIDKFLSRPQLQTTAAADAIIDSLGQGNYFPSNKISDISGIVEDDIAILHADALPYLVHKLVGTYEADTGPAKNAARSFLYGLAALKRPAIRGVLQKSIIKGKGQSIEYADIVVSLLRLDPELDRDLNKAERERVVALLKAVIAKTTHDGKISKLANPLGWLVAFLQERGQEEIWKDYQPVVTELLKTYTDDPELMKALTAAGEIQSQYLAIFEERARSWDFGISNAAAKTVPTISELLGESMPAEHAFRIVAAVLSAAQHNAWSAEELKTGKFAQAPILRTRVKKFGSSSASKPIAAQILKEYGVLDSVSDVVKLLKS